MTQHDAVPRGEWAYPQREPPIDFAWTLPEVIWQLRSHMETHTEWAESLEGRPYFDTTDIGDAAFHRRIEATYTGMITFLEQIAARLEAAEQDNARLRDSLRGIGEILRVLYSDYLALQQRLEAVEKEVTALRAFCQEVYSGWPEDTGLDGFDLQDLAEKYGLLKSVEATERCGEVCQCANETDFPTTCFRRTSLLTGNPESDAVLDAQIAKDQP